MRYWRKDIGTEVSYLSVIGALMYLANYTRPDIIFVMSILVRHSANPIRSLEIEKDSFRP